MRFEYKFHLSYHHIITRRRSPIGFLPEVWSPLQATVHQCGIFYLPWHRRSGYMYKGPQFLVSSDRPSLYFNYLVRYTFSSTKITYWPYHRAGNREKIVLSLISPRTFTPHSNTIANAYY
jgi:hypothetical protein